MRVKRDKTQQGPKIPPKNSAAQNFRNTFLYKAADVTPKSIKRVVWQQRVLGAKFVLEMPLTRNGLFLVWSVSFGHGVAWLRLSGNNNCFT